MILLFVFYEYLFTFDSSKVHEVAGISRSGHYRDWQHFLMRKGLNQWQHKSWNFPGSTDFPAKKSDFLMKTENIMLSLQTYCKAQGQHMHRNPRQVPLLNIQAQFRGFLHRLDEETFRLLYRKLQILTPRNCSGCSWQSIIFIKMNGKWQGRRKL